MLEIVAFRIVEIGGLQHLLVLVQKALIAF